LNSDANGNATITLPVGTYNYQAADDSGNKFSGTFTIIKDMTIAVAVAFRNVISFKKYPHQTGE
jgi:hypothetical protein